MSDPIAFLEETVQESKKRPAIDVHGEDAEAYNKEAVQWCKSEYTPKKALPALQKELAAIPSSNPLRRLDAISNVNLDLILMQTREMVASAVKARGEKAVNELIEAAQKTCHFSNIALTHNPDWSHSVYSNQEESLLAILKDKSLKAPHYYLPEGAEDATLISCGIRNKSDPVQVSGTYFMTNTLSDEVAKRSMGVISLFTNDKDLSFSTIVGGEQLQAAWLLATINNALFVCADKERMPELPKDITHFAFEDTFNELKIPRQLSLVGENLVRDGEIEKIKPSRAQPKKAVQKRDLTPDLENPDLRQQPRGRGKAK